jgi:hypothetical protein
MIRSGRGIPLLIAGLLFLSACGPLEVGIEPPSSRPTNTPPPTIPIEEATPTPEAPAATPSPEPEATVEEPSPTPTSPPAEEPASPLWAQYWDPLYGYGLALPCYWVIYPPPPDAVAGSPSIRSYDEWFAMEHSVRGQWIDGQWPPGAVKLEIIVAEGIDPDLPLGPAAQGAMEEMGFPVESVEEVVIGRHDAVLAHLGDMGIPGAPDRVPVFRLTPDRLILFSVMPGDALDSPDLQGLLESLVRSDAEEIAVPTFDPSGPVDGRGVYLDQEAGYCISYPTDFVLEEVAPSQPTVLGNVAYLTIERPLYDVRGAIEVLKVPADSDLGALVDALRGDSAREESEVPGPPSQLGGELAITLQGDPISQGWWHVYALHGDRLYHLFVTPSATNIVQAEGDTGLLYGVVSSTFTFLP